MSKLTIPIDHSSSRATYRKRLSNDGSLRVAAPDTIEPIALGDFKNKHGRLIATRIEKRLAMNKKLRWREFEAELTPSRLELYLLSKKGMIRRLRLAHTIDLAKCHLSLVSPIDYAWKLFYYHRSVQISFIFLFLSPSKSHEWYTAVHRLIGSTRRVPIPSHIYLSIPTVHLKIGIPLPFHDNPDYTIHAHQVVKAVESMLGPQLHEHNPSLCWQRDGYAEWIADDEAIVGPQITEHTHELELHSRSLEHIQHFYRLPPVCEGFVNVILKPTQPSRRWYACLEGYSIFLIDPAKALVTEAPPTSTFRTLFQISTAIFSSFRLTHIYDPTNDNDDGDQDDDDRKERFGRAANVAQASYVIHLSRVKSVYAPSRRGTSCILVLEDDRRVQVETSSSSVTSEWVLAVRRNIAALTTRKAQPRLDPLFESLQWRHAIILQCGQLYIKKKAQGTFEKRWCLVTRNGWLVMFSIVERTPVTSKAHEHAWLPRTMILPLDEAYIYSGHHLQGEVEAETTPAQWYADGTISNGGENHMTKSFVIWKARRRHVVASLRERVAWIKRGHRLGRKGTVWIFRTKTDDECRRWILALQHTKNGRL